MHGWGETAKKVEKDEKSVIKWCEKKIIVTFALWMMKIFPNICLALTALALVFAACSHSGSYDKRLVAADSLLTAGRADSALSLLTSIAPSSLSSDADQAYHALLTTQARYKSFAVITSDDEINTAVNYYEHHDTEREKLIRSYIYKGGVMQELSKPDTAMIFYKMAEVKAAEADDYSNLGYARLRMGELYFKHHAYDGRNIEKIEQALDCYRRVNDLEFQANCLEDLGVMYRQTNPQKAEKTLKEAISMAENNGNTEQYISCVNDLAHLYFMMGSDNAGYNKKAYDQLQIIKSHGIENREDVVYITFANVYSALGMPDSAMYYLQLSGHENDTDSRYRTNFLEALSNIAKARGDSIAYLHLINECSNLSFALMRDPELLNIMYAENDFDRQYERLREEKQQRSKFTYIGIGLALILALAGLALAFYRRAHRYDRLVVELKDQSQSQMRDLSGLQTNISEMKINDERLKGFISSHMSMMREMIEACYHEPRNRIAENMKRIVKFQDSNRDNWVKLYDYIDVEHNNIMTRTRENYPQLNDRDLLLLALTCMGYSYIQTAIIMGYSNATSVSVIKQRLAKKMGLECTLNEYIEHNSTYKIEQKEQ